MNYSNWGRWLSRLFKQGKTPRGKGRRLRLEPLEERLAPAATATWLGNGANTNWSNGANWKITNPDVAGQIIPQPGDNLVFDGTALAAHRTTTNDIPLVNPVTGVESIYSSISINASGYTLGGSVAGGEIGLSGALNVGQSVGSPEAVPLGAGPVQILGSLKLLLVPALNQTITVGTGSFLDIQGQLIGGTPGQTLTKAGTGTLYLDGANTTYTGAFTLANSGGVVVITSATALGAPGVGTTTINSNSQLQIDGVNMTAQIGENLIVNGSGISGDGALLETVSPAAPNNFNTWSANITMDSDTSFGANPGTTLKISGQINDLGSSTGHNLTKVGAGQIDLTHVGGDTYRGTTTVAAGVLNIQDPNALGNSLTHQSTTFVLDNTGVIPNIRGTLQLDFVTGSVVGRTGFTVANELLVLNGPGAVGAGALENFAGNNVWSGNVTLGGTTSAVASSIGVDSVAGAATNLLISGVIGDSTVPPVPNTLTKVGTGRLILTAVNTYIDATNVAAGILNVEDSQALGPVGKAAGTTVAGGAALELELQSDTNVLGSPNYGLIPLIGSYNYGLTPTPQLDSVTNTFNKLVFTQPLTLAGTGINVTGALHSISGINLWNGNVVLVGVTGIGVEPDPNAESNINYFTNDYSLTIGPTGVLSGGGLEKVDNGQLILPGANAYGTTDIHAGWITAQNNDSLGPPNPLVTQTLQIYTLVESGAALQLKPLVPGTSLTLNNNFILIGNGISAPDTNFGQITKMGAIESLDGLNTLSGIIQLSNQAGIGVEQVFPGTVAGAISSQLTLTGYLTDNTSNGGIAATPGPFPNAGDLIKDGSQRLIIQGPGSYTGAVDVTEGPLLDQNNTALGFNDNPAYFPAGAALPDSGNDQTTTVGNANNGIATVLTLNLLGASAGPSGSSTTFTITINGQYAVTQPGGLVTTQSFTDTTAPITYTGVAAGPTGDVASIVAALNALPDVITANGGFNGFTAASATPTTLGTVAANTLDNLYTITFGGGLTGLDQTATAQVTSGTGTFSQVQSFALNSPTANTTKFTLTFPTTGKDASGDTVQTLGLTAATATVGPNQTIYSLTLNGNSAAGAFTNTLAVPAYTGVAATDAANIQQVLNSMPGVLAANGGVPGAISVTANASDNFFTITFGGALRNFNQNVTATVTSGTGTFVQLTTTTTAPITYTGVAATDVANIQSALNALSTISGVNGTVGGTNVEQTVSLTGGVGGVTKFKLTFNGVTTAGSVTYQASAGSGATPDALAIQTALNGLTSINTTGSVAVNQLSTGVFLITFGGGLAGANQPQITGAITAGPGSVFGSTEGVISEVQTANGPIFTVVFGGALTSVNKPLITGAVTASTGSFSEVQTISLPLANANTTQFNLTYNNDVTPQPIAFLGSPGAGITPDSIAVQAALNALTSINSLGSVAVDQLSTGVYQVNFLGAQAPVGLAGYNQSQITGGVVVQTLTLTGGTAGTTQFNLTFKGVTTTTPVIFQGSSGAGATQDAMDVASALNSLSSINTGTGSVTVSQVSTGVFLITFQGGLLNANQPQITGSIFAGTGSIAGTTPGSFAANSDGAAATQNHGGGATLELGNTITTQDGGLQGGLNVFDEHLILNGTGDAAFGDSGALTVLSSNSLASSPVDDPLVPIDNLWNGPITLNSNSTIEVTHVGVGAAATSSRLVVNGVVDDGNGNSSLTLVGGGELDLAGANTYKGTTYIDGSSVLTAENNQALGAGGIAPVQTIAISTSTPNSTTYNLTFGGSTTQTPLAFNATNTQIAQALMQLPSIGGGGSADVGGSVIVSPPSTSTNAGVTTVVYTVTLGGSLTGFSQQPAGSSPGQEPITATLANGTGSFSEVQTLTVNGGTAGSTAFNLSFNGFTTPSSIAYTGTAADAANIANALNALMSVSGVGGSVMVTQSSPGIYLVSFGGALANGTTGFNQPQITGSITAGSGSIAGNTGVFGAGGTLVSNSSSLQLAASVNIPSEPLVVEGTGPGAPSNLPTQWFQVGPAAIDNGQTAGNMPVSGRVTGIVTDPNDGNVIYITTSGGAWKTIDGGQTWRPLFDAIPDIQTITVLPTAVTPFTLSYGGLIASTYNLANITTAALASSIQAGLDSLATIGGVGGYVTVTYVVSPPGALPGTVVFTVTFGGALAGESINPSANGLLPQISPLVVGGDANVIAASTGQGTEAGEAPQFTSDVSAIAIDPNNPNILYIGTGETGSAPSTDNYFGTGLYESTNAGATWVLVAGAGATSNPFYGYSITAIAVDPLTGDLFVADSNENIDGPLPPYTPPLAPIPPPITGSTTAPIPGVWRLNNVTAVPTPGVFTGSSWFLMTDTISAARLTLVGLQSAPPDTPGPDDDFRINFPELGLPEGFLGPVVTAVSWTDLHVIDTVIANDGAGPGPIVPVLYAALGTTTGDINNGIFRDQGANVSTVWYAGDPGLPQDQVEEVTITGPAFPAGALNLEFPAGSGNITMPTDFFPDVNESGMGPWAEFPAGGNSPGLQTLLNNLPTIGGVGGAVTVTFNAALSNVATTVYDITFGGTLGFSPQPLIGVIGSFGVSQVNPPTAVIVPGGGVDTQSVGTPGGEWPFDAAAGGPFLTTGLFPHFGASYGDIKFSIAPLTAPNILDNVTIYASVATPNGGGFGFSTLKNIYVSGPTPLPGQGGGKNWLPTTYPGNDLADTGYYSNAIVAQNASTVYIGGSLQDPSATLQGQVLRSPDGGITWDPNPPGPGGDISTDASGNGPHSSQHAMFIDPTTGDLLVGNDGGIWQWNPNPAPNGTWTDLNGNLDITQVNSVAAASTNLNSLVIGANDNAIDATNPLGSSQVWTQVDDNSNFGVNSGNQVVIDPNNANNVYAVETPTDLTFALYQPYILYSTTGVNGPYAPYPLFTGILNPLFFSTTATIAEDQINGDRLLVGGQGFIGSDLMETLDASQGAGAAWVNLAANIPGFFGGVSGGVTGIALPEYQGTFTPDPLFPNVTDLGANQDDPNTIYITDGTNILVTKDNANPNPAGPGSSPWENLTTAADNWPFPAGNIQQIVVDPSNRDTLYAVVNNYGTGNVFKFTPATLWQEVGESNKLPNLPVWSLAIDPRNGTLYAGTDNGVYTEPEGSGPWKPFSVGLAGVSVHSLTLNQSTNVLLAGTYGRGTYELFLDTVQTAGSATVSGPLVALSGSNSWGGPVIVEGNPAIGPLKNEVIFGTDGTLNLPNGLSAGQLTISGQISDLTAGGNASIVKIGNGDVVLQGANIYGGTTTVQSGALVVDNAQALGTVAANPGTTVDSGAALEMLTSLDAYPVTLIGDGIPSQVSTGITGGFNSHNTGALRNLSGFNTFGGVLTLTGAETTIGVESGSQLSIGAAGAGALTGAGVNLTKEGTGTLVLTSSNPTYTGTTSVNQGALQLQNSGALGTGGAGTGSAVVLDGAAVQLQSPTGGPGLTMTSLLTLSGTGIDATGIGTGALLSTGGNNTWAGPITFTPLPGFAPPTYPSGQVGVGANTGATLTIDSPGAGIQETVPTGLLKVDPGTVILAGPNDFSGGVEIAEGALDVQNPTALGVRPTANAADPLGAVQRITTISPTQTGGFTLTFGGASTPLLGPAPSFSFPFAAPALTVQNALNKLSSILGLGSVSVTQTPIQVSSEAGTPLASSLTPANTKGYVYTVTFLGGLSSTTQQLSVTGDIAGDTTAGVSVVSAGATDVTVDPVPASSVSALPTIPIDFQSVGVQSSGITFANLTGAVAATVGTLLPGSATQAQIQTLAFTAGNTGDTFTLSVNGVTTAPITFTTDGSLIGNIQAALNAIAGGPSKVPSTVAAGTTGAELQLDGSTSVPTVANPSTNLTVSGYTLTLNGSGVASVDGALNNIIGNNVWNGPLVLATPSATSLLPNLTASTTNSVGVVNSTFLLTFPTAGVTHTVSFTNVTGTVNATVTNPVSGAGAVPAVFGLNFTAGKPGDTFVLTIDNVQYGPITYATDGSLAGNINSVLNPNTTVATASGPGSLTLSGGVSVQVIPTSNGNLSTNATLTKVNAGTLIFPDFTTTFPITFPTAGQQNPGLVFIPGTGKANAIVATSFNTTGNEVQTLEFTAGNPGDTFSLSVNGVTTAPITYATDGTLGGLIQAAIMAALTAVGATPPTVSLSNSQTQTIIDAGSVQVDGTIGAVELNGGTLSGQTPTAPLTGSVGTVTAGPLGGTIDPGDNFPTEATGTLTVSGTNNPTIPSVTLSHNDQFFVDLSDPSTPNDVLSVTNGSINLNDATLTGMIDGGVSLNDQYVILKTDYMTNSADQIMGTFGVNGIAVNTNPVVTMDPSGLNLAPYASTIAYIDNTKFVVDYFLDDVVITQQLANVVTITTAVTPTATGVVPYGQKEYFTATFTPEPLSPVPSGFAIFSITGVNGSSNPVQFQVPIVPGATTGVATFDPTAAAALNEPFPPGLYTLTQVFYDGVTFPASNPGGVQTFNSIMQSSNLTIEVNLANTKTTVTSSNPTAVYGQPVTFTATVATTVLTANVVPGTTPPSGTVNFYIGSVSGTLLGTGTLNTNPSTMVTTAFITTLPGQLVVGSGQSIIGVYSGDTNYNGSTSASARQTINKSTTTTTITSPTPPSSSVYGQPVTFVATISPGGQGGQFGSTPPSGTVTFKDNGVILGTVTVTTSPITGAQTATYTTTVVNGVPQLPLGVKETITASYSGDSNYTSSSGTLLQTVTVDSTSTTLSSSIPNSVIGQPVTFTATVQPASPGAAPPVGSVQFFLNAVSGANSVLLGTVMLSTSPSSGLQTASYTTLPNQLPLGNGQTVIANYLGTANFGPSQGPLPSGQTVTQDLTTTTVNSSDPSSIFGQGTPVTFTATVALNGPGIAPPTGTVQFYLGDSVTGTLLGTANLVTINGMQVATYTTTAGQLPAGTSETITALYTGGMDYLSSQGTLLNGQTVGQDNTATTVTSSAASSVYGQAVTFTATIMNTSTTQPASGGTVSFYNGDQFTGTLLGIGGLSTNLVTGVVTATYTTTLGQLIAGSNYTITAAYSGSNNFAGSSGTLNGGETVTADPTTTIVNSSANPSSVGQQVTFTATVTPNLPGSGNPDGIVKFYDLFLDGNSSPDAGNLLGSVTGTLSLNGVVTASYTTTGAPIPQLPAGNNEPIVAVYTDNLDGNYIGSQGNLPGGQTVLAVGNETSSTVIVAPTPTGVPGSGTTTYFGQPVTFTATVTDTGPPPQVGATTSGSPSVQDLAQTVDFAVGESVTGNGIPGNTTIQSIDSPTSITLSQDASATGSTTLTFGAPFTPITPTGNVTFYDGTTLLGSGQVTPTGGAGSPGTASYTTSAFQLQVGNNSITALYSGDPVFNLGTLSAAQTQTVSAAPTQATVTSSLNPSSTGQSVTFTATVQVPADDGNGLPNGPVSFYVGSVAPGNILGTSMLSNVGGVMTASYTTTPNQLVAGNGETIIANYVGNNNFGPSQASLTGGQTVIQVGHELSTTTVGSSQTPSVYGQTVTFTATVKDAGTGGFTPTGTVVFYDGSTLLGTGMLSTTGGVTTGSYTTSATMPLSVSTHVITAVYSGDTNFALGTASQPFLQVVNPSASQVLVSSGSNPASYGQSVTFSAVVLPSGAGAGLPTGQVQFFLGGTNGTLLGVGNLTVNPVSGLATATYTTLPTQLPLGTQTITASYGGDIHFTASVGTLAQGENVVQAGTTTAISASPNGTQYGVTTTFTATITPAGGGTPTGTVTFFDGNTALGTVNVSTLGGVTTASFPTATLTGGDHPHIFAVYNGDTNFFTSTSGFLDYKVQQDHTQAIISVSGAGTPPVATFTATIVPTQGAGVPDGKVTFIIENSFGTQVGGGVVSLSGGQATLQVANLPPGQYTLEVIYGGSVNFIGTSNFKQFTVTPNAVN